MTDTTERRPARSRLRAGIGTVVAVALAVAGVAAWRYQQPPLRKPLAVLPDGRLDPTKIDLSGVPGVTPAEQRRAEDLLRRTLLALPRWNDVKTAVADGFVSLGDTNPGGYVHYVSVRYGLDKIILDPHRPESLVYRKTRSGSLELVAAMFSLLPHQDFRDVPDVGGKLMQWHVHGKLCFEKGTFRGKLRQADGTCPKGSQPPPDSVPMIHVWIVPRMCGPFSALEGLGGGETPQGSTVWCDRVHGA